MALKVKTKIDDPKVHDQEEEGTPVSPLGQYLNSSVVSLSLYAVLEFQAPVDDLPTSLIQEVFLPINPRFSCIMVRTYMLYLEFDRFFIFNQE